jgi:hypothetical protein
VAKVERKKKESFSFGLFKPSKKTNSQVLLLLKCFSNKLTKEETYLNKVFSCTTKKAMFLRKTLLNRMCYLFLKYPEEENTKE